MPTTYVSLNISIRTQNFLPLGSFQPLAAYLTAFAFCLHSDVNPALGIDTHPPPLTFPYMNSSPILHQTTRQDVKCAETGQMFIVLEVMTYLFISFYLTHSPLIPYTSWQSVPHRLFKPSYSHIRPSLGVLKSLDENTIMVFLLSVFP